MADLVSIEEQLKRINCNYRLWGKWDAKELTNVLLPGETIEHCVNGIYEGGFGQMTATDQRLILIDRKPMYLTLEDIRFDMVSELDYNHRLLNSTLKICTPNKTLAFRSYSRDKLRNLFNFAQRRVMEIRHYYMEQQTTKTTPQAQNLAGEASWQQPFPVSQSPQAIQPQQPPQQMMPPTPAPQYGRWAWQEMEGPQPQSGYPQFQPSEPPQPATDFVPQVVQSQQTSGHHVSPQHLGVSAVKRMLPLLNAYTRSPIMSRRSGYAMHPGHRVEQARS